MTQAWTNTWHSSPCVCQSLFTKSDTYLPLIFLTVSQKQSDESMNPAEPWHHDGAVFISWLCLSAAAAKCQRNYDRLYVRDVCAGWRAARCNRSHFFSLSCLVSLWQISEEKRSTSGRNSWPECLTEAKRRRFPLPLMRNDPEEKLHRHYSSLRCPLWDNFNKFVQNLSFLSLNTVKLS